MILSQLLMLAIYVFGVVMVLTDLDKLYHITVLIFLLNIGLRVLK